MIKEDTIPTTIIVGLNAGLSSVVVPVNKNIGSPIEIKTPIAPNMVVYTPKFARDFAVIAISAGKE